MHSYIAISAVKSCVGLTVPLSSLDCDGDVRWKTWRRLFQGQGVQSAVVVKSAVELYHSIRWDEVVSQTRAALDDDPDFVEYVSDVQAQVGAREPEWSAELVGSQTGHLMFTSDPYFLEWSTRSIAIFKLLLLLGSGKGEPKIQSLFDGRLLSSSVCLFGPFSPFSLLMVHYAVYHGFKSDPEISVDMRAAMRLELVGAMSLVLNLPFHTLDLLDVFWNVSSLDIAANMQYVNDNLHYSSFEKYAHIHPVPLPYLPHWSFDAPLGLQATSLHVHRTFRARVRQASIPVKVAIMHLHDATAWDDWFSLQTAWVSLAGKSPPLEPRFYFVRVQGLRGCSEDDEINRHLAAPYAALRDFLDEIKSSRHRGLDTARQFLQYWWAHGDTHALQDSNILLCGEPVWLCPILTQIVHGSGPQHVFLMRFNMAILDEFLYSDGGLSEPLQQWWDVFYGVIATGKVFASIGTRYTVEQLAHQTCGKVRFPYVPFLGLHYGTMRRTSRARHEVLLFHNNLQPFLVFKMGLQMVAASEGFDREVHILDMNDMPRGLCRPEMGDFEAAVLLPHNPAPIRLVDLYAQGVVLYVPAEPLMHRWIWANRPFGGYMSPLAYTSIPLNPCTFPNTSTLRPPTGHPPFSATIFLTSWAPHANLAHRRYWLQYTEWELLPGLQRFASISDLLHNLRNRQVAEMEWVREAMHLNMQGRRADALAWWQAALAADGVVTFEQ